MYIKPLEHSRKHHRTRLRQLTREIRKERKIKYRTHGCIQGYIPEPDHRIPTPITVSNTVLSTLFFSFLLHSIAFGYNCHCPYNGKSYSLPPCSPLQCTCPVRYVTCWYSLYWLASDSYVPEWRRYSYFDPHSLSLFLSRQASVSPENCPTLITRSPGRKCGEFAWQLLVLAGWGLDVEGNSRSITRQLPHSLTHQVNQPITKSSLFDSIISSMFILLAYPLW